MRMNSVCKRFFRGKRIPVIFSRMTSSTPVLSAETSWDPESRIPHAVLLYIKTNSGVLSTKSKYQQLNFFFQLVSLLKEQKRTGWINMGIPDPETISDHMYRMSIMTLVLDPKAWPGQAPDLNKCSRIALVHDIAESLVGDIVPHDEKIDKAEKSKREYKAMLYLCDIVSKYCPESADEMRELWIDYETQRNLEATIVKDIDKLELLVQAFEYERMHSRRMDEFYACRKVIKNSEIQQLADELIEQRDQLLKEKNL